MSVNMILLVIFVTSFGLIAGALYLISEVPKRRQLLDRLQALGTLVEADARIDAERLKDDLLKQASALDRILLQIPWSVRLQNLVEQSGVRMDAPSLVLIALGLAALALLSLVLLPVPTPFGIALVIGCFLAPFLFIIYQRQQRLRRFEEQFPEAMDMLARAVRAGYAFTTALELIADEMPQPVAREFQITYDQQNLGLPLREALDHLQRRIPLADVRIFVTLLKMQQDSGGNLAEMLDNLSMVVRERFKLLRQVQVHTAEGRMSMVVLGVLPPVAGMMFFFTNPRYIMPLFTDPLGHQMLAAGFVMQVIGVLWIRKIIHLKV